MRRLLCFSLTIWLVYVGSMAHLFPSCVNKECSSSSCWTFTGQGNCTEYDYTTAFVDYSTAGGGTRTVTSPTQAIRKRTRPNCTDECADQTDGRASGCMGTVGNWTNDGNSYYCQQGGGG